MLINNRVDPSNIIGFGIALIIFLIIILNNGDIRVFIDIPSILIVFGGTIASTLNSYPITSILHTFKVIFLLFTRGINFPYYSVIDQIVKLAEIIRKEGPLALEKQKIINPFLERGVYYIIDGTKTEVITDILELDTIALMERHKEGQQILESMGSFAPAWGMIGTLIGLVFMLLSLDSPSKIGPAMAVALLTTFYGAVLANLVFIPVATKLENLSKEEILFRKFIIEGIISIANSDNPRIIREKLLAFLSPEEKAIKLKELERLRKARFA